MGTIADKLNRTYTSKLDIRSAINDKGVSCADDVPLRDYGNLIRRIESGGGQIVDMITSHVSLTRPNEIIVTWSCSIQSLITITRPNEIISQASIDITAEAYEEV